MNGACYRKGGGKSVLFRSGLAASSSGAMNGFVLAGGYTFLFFKNPHKSTETAETAFVRDIYQGLF
jgi:hypothetical protein